MPPPPPPPPLPPPPQLRTPPVRNARRTNKLRMLRQLRRRAGMPTNNRQASVVQTVANQGTPGRLGRARTADDGAVVETARVADPAVVPVMFTGLVEPKLKVGGNTEPDRKSVVKGKSVARV